MRVCFVFDRRYAYHGSEPLYSGVTGTVMHADIFIGLVYYQRLRHMVSDKAQVRCEREIGRERYHDISHGKSYRRVPRTGRNFYSIARWGGCLLYTSDAADE